MRILVINPNASVEMSDVIREQLHAVARPDIRVDVVNPEGAPPAIESAFGALRRGGRLLIFGVARGDATVSLSPFRIYNDEITIVGSMAVLHSFDRAVDLMAAGAVDADTMISHTYPLDEYGAAVEAFRAGMGRKLQIRPGARDASVHPATPRAA